jgi:hypothetical protein
MNFNDCAKEQAVVAALQSGMLDDELLSHAGSCAVCSEVLLVTEFLRTEFLRDESAALELPTPDAAMIWRKAQNRAREKALARATYPIRVARTSACALAILAAPWIVVELAQRPWWLQNLGLTHFVSMDVNWLAAVTGTMLAGMTATFLCIALSSWYILRQE